MKPHIHGITPSDSDRKCVFLCLILGITVSNLPYSIGYRRLIKINEEKNSIRHEKQDK
jgi:hypothetical protein